MINKIEPIASKKKEITINQTAYTTHFNAYLDNPPIPSLTTPFGKILWTNTANKTEPNIHQTYIHLKQ